MTIIFLTLDGSSSSCAKIFAKAATASAIFNEKSRFKCSEKELPFAIACIE